MRLSCAPSVWPLTLPVLPDPPCENHKAESMAATADLSRQGSTAGSEQGEIPPTPPPSLELIAVSVQIEKHVDQPQSTSALVRGRKLTIFRYVSHCLHGGAELAVLRGLGCVPEPRDEDVAYPCPDGDPRAEKSV